MKPLLPWMRFVLRFVGIYNVLAGLSMLCFYHEGYKLLGIAKPDVNLPIQLVGILVGLFGVGYWLVSRHPVENRNLLMLGFWSKALGSVLGLYYLAVGKLPPLFLVMLFFSDIIYLPPFLIIMRRLYKIAAQRRAESAQSLPRAA